MNKAYCEPPPAPQADWKASADEPTAECTQCREPTEYVLAVPGAPLCARCEWLGAQRTACSG